MTTDSVQTELLNHLDQQLFQRVSGIDILDSVAPLNYREQRQAFFDCHYSIDPSFVYKQRELDAFAVKRSLFNLPVDQVADDDIRQIYLDVVDSYIDKIDQLRSIGSPEFLYDSLRYFGEPSDKDVRNAQFVLHLPETFEPEDNEFLDANAIETVLRAFAEQHQYQYQLRIDDAMIANAIVSGDTVKINSAAKVSKTETQALAHHELGVHLLTTLNARSQPLRILSLGSPVNTKTQEGLAILSEYLGGCMTIRRLKVLALRVLAVESMIKEKNFRNTFLMLKEDHGVEDQQAFTITARVYRGGGFTKDYLYLQGFHQVLNAFEQDPNFYHLLSGKTSLDHLPLITRLIDKGILYPPKLITPAFANPVANDDIKRFITHAIM